MVGFCPTVWNPDFEVDQTEISYYWLITSLLANCIYVQIWIWQLPRGHKHLCNIYPRFSLPEESDESDFFVSDLSRFLNKSNFSVSCLTYQTWCCFLKHDRHTHLFLLLFCFTTITSFSSSQYNLFLWLLNFKAKNLNKGTILLKTHRIQQVIYSFCFSMTPF